MKRTLLWMTLSLWGCGLPEETPAPSTESPILTEVGPKGPIESIALPAGLRRQPEVLREAPQVPDGLGVTLTGLPESGELRAVAGMMGCGFWEIGAGTVAISGGRAEVSMKLDPTAQGLGFSLFFFVDQHGDGLCTDEEVLSAELPSLPAAGLTFDLKSLPTTYGGSCWLFR